MSKKAKIAAAIKEAKQNLKVSTEGVGDLLWTDPVPNWACKAEIVTAAFAVAGLDPMVFLPKAPDYGTAFSRSILAVRTAIQGRGYTLLAAGDGPNGESRYSVMAVSRNGSVTTADQACVQCPKDGTAPFVERSSEDPQAEDIANLIVQASKQREGCYTSDDVRQSVLMMLHLYHAQSTRTSAPHTHYWVPAAGVPYLAKLGEVLAALGWGTIDSFEGAATAKNFKVIARTVNNSLEAEIAEFEAEAAKYASAEKGYMVQRKIEAGEALAEKAEMLQAILGQGVESLAERIAEIRATLDITLIAEAAE